MWLEQLDCGEVIKDSWETSIVGHDAPHTLVTKLRCLRKIQRKWEK